MILQGLANALISMAQPVHPTLFPFPWVSTLHAARISIAYQANARRSPTSLPWVTYIAGYLIMCWGGTFISRNLLGQPQPTLYSVHLYVNYITVHLTLTFVFDLFPSLLNPKLFDTILFPIDALVRTPAITGAVHLLSNTPHPSVASVHPILVQSPLTHMIMGGIASSGGGLTAATLSTWTPSWSFSTPPLFRGETGIWGTLDTWAGSLVAGVYGFVTGHDAFSDIAAALERAGLISAEGIKMDSLQGQALITAILTVLFGIRAWKVHWATPAVPSNEEDEKSKVQ